MSERVDPTGKDLKKFLEEDDGKPIVMLNLLRFKTDGGRESYNKYARAIVPFLEQVGGEVVYFGSTATPLVQPTTNNDWDAVLLVRYPSRAAFSQMVANPDYQAITHLRTEALDAAVLQPTAAR
jgi:uncharacterized protein (DUF1330 family)